jgi:hypothetical protein
MQTIKDRNVGFSGAGNQLLHMFERVGRLQTSLDEGIQLSIGVEKVIERINKNDGSTRVHSCKRLKRYARQVKPLYLVCTFISYPSMVDL